MKSYLRITLKTLGPIAMLIWLASNPHYFTTWLTGVWGIIALIGLLQNDKAPSGQPTLMMPASLQFILAVVLIASTCMASNWYAPEQREIIQAGYALFTLALYREGFHWCLRSSGTIFYALRRGMKSPN